MKKKPITLEKMIDSANIRSMEYIRGTWIVTRQTIGRGQDNEIVIFRHESLRKAVKMAFKEAKRINVL